jgi:hypothetical protein
MSESIRHARSVSPYLIPNKGNTPASIHGLTNTNLASSVDSEDVFVVGKSDRCATDKGIPEATVTLPQLERGEIETYLRLANLDSEPSNGLTLLDFSSGLVDYVQFERDSFDGEIEQTKWVPKATLTSLTLDIADPEARIERTIELLGDNKHELAYDNKLLIHKAVTAGSGVSGSFVINVSDPIPSTDPNNSGSYILRVDRTRAGETETISTWTYDSGTQEITVTDAETDDVYRVYYSAQEFGTSDDPTTVDSGNPCFLKASNVTVLIGDENTEVELDLLTSLSITATIERINESVIGSKERVLREISSTPVDVSLSGRVKDSSILLAFMQKLGVQHGITDINKYLDVVSVTVKIYSDDTKSTFLLGYKTTGLAFTDDSQDMTANEFGTLDVSASSTNLLITTDEDNL